jgi:hypothetical protein
MNVIKSECFKVRMLESPNVRKFERPNVGKFQSLNVWICSEFGMSKSLKVKIFVGIVKVGILECLYILQSEC